MERESALLSGYNVHRESDRQEMLNAIGVSSMENLFRSVPKSIRLARPLNLPLPCNEWQLRKRLQTLADKNATVRSHLSFLGGGAYEHYIPAVVDVICTRGEFLTAYTPYQPEMSQGLLQVLFEYQQLLATLTKLPLVNCSLYDGATALAEAAWMACAITKVKRVLAAETIWPPWQQVLRTYMNGRDVEVVTLRADPRSGQLDLAAVREALSQPAATVILQTPNSMGVVEDVAEIANLGRQHGTLINASCYPISLGVLEPPGGLGADIVTCEGQSLGLPLSAGGPYLGILATHARFEDFLPGRLVGRLTDLRGEVAFALVKESREQHVSREKATSHICSNQALQAMRAAVYLACLGEHGFRDVARQNAAKARYLCDRLCAIRGVRRAFTGPFFNEFALTFPCPVPALLKTLTARGILGGLEIAGREDVLLLAVTEVRSKTELDHAAAAFQQAVTELTSGVL